jgi:hypothetical protein
MAIPSPSTKTTKNENIDQVALRVCKLFNLNFAFNDCLLLVLVSLRLVEPNFLRQRDEIA